MDQAVGLVQAYLRVNGYFTVTEYPVILSQPGGGFRVATDLDILAVRFPHAGNSPARADSGNPGERGIPDTALGVPEDQPDMLIGEVKEGRAELNAGATNPAVLHAVLTRFGCCDDHSARHIVEQLKRRGRAVLPNEHPVRLVAFGSTTNDVAGGSYHRVTHGHMIRFLNDYLRQHWESLHVSEVKDQALGLLALLEKAKRSGR